MLPIDTKKIEKHWLDYWEKERIYAFDKNSKPVFSIDTPPPTVSGEMHIGHAYSYSQQDFIARYKRMQGFSVFYPFGTDDNGLPTEKLIQKIKNVKSKDFSRQEFIELCLKTLKEITPAFIQDWKNIGVSCDYNLYYSTINDNSRKMSQKMFLELYKQGLVYKTDFPTIWDTEFQTPVAQAELEDREKESLFTTIKFHVQEKILPIATTRPELLGACLAIFVNPEDKRYKHFIGKKATVPIFNNLVPILADAHAEMEKGTGALMICSYGDKQDVEAVKKHKLTPRVIITKEGKINAHPYEGLYIKEARAKILEDLQNQNLIIKQEKIKHVTNVYEKSGREIEFLPTEQWFIKILDKKSVLLKQGKKINWYPKHMQKRYENWIHGLEWDWSISRERHFGIPIPVWHCRSCNHIILAKESELPIDPVQKEKICDKCKMKAEPETKVLDTWATSSLTPQIASSLVNNKIKLPYSLRPQAHDIIRTWAFYTIVRSLYHEKKIPWKDTIISGFVTLEGQKMSKSKGNGIKPQTIMEEFSADALRYAAASSKLGEDSDYQEKDIITGKKFVTKILNATNFVFMNLKYQKQAKLHETDRLLLQQLNQIIDSATESFNSYNYSKAKLDTESFFWKTFADNYLEIVKNRVYNGTKEEKESAFYTLYQSLLAITKMMAPITPFIAEEIYQQHFKKHEKAKSIHLSKWPDEFKIKKTKEDGKVWNRMIELISSVRQAKSEAQKSMKAEIILTLPKSDHKLLVKLINDIKAVTGAKTIEEGEFKIEFT
ncbi:valine--tRNA ligase [Candidatus Pacearchaeota archaeon CG1_02_32_132]|nr:MAG: valine--tRNA ligase [Candidatus Pacearchaeota archaeon CG1_02_32_132]